MKIKSPKDFWSGLMFVAFGLFFLAWAIKSYQMGTAVRMGPAYFPTMLGGLMAVLGAIVLAGSFAPRADGSKEKLTLPFNIVDLGIATAIFLVFGYVAKLAGWSNDYAMLAAAAVVSALSVLYRPETRPLVLISAGCIAYGYLMKPLGLVGATAALVYVSAFGGHEYKWKEVTILFVVLILFSWLVFVRGLTLPFPLCPQFIENCPIR